MQATHEGKRGRENYKPTEDVENSSKHDLTSLNDLAIGQNLDKSADAASYDSHKVDGVTIFFKIVPVQQEQREQETSPNQMCHYYRSLKNIDADEASSQGGADVVLDFIGVRSFQTIATDEGKHISHKVNCLSCQIRGANHTLTKNQQSNYEVVAIFKEFLHWVEPLSFF